MFAIAPYLKEIEFWKTETGVVGAIIFFSTMAPLANLHSAAHVASRHDTRRKKYVSVALIMPQLLHFNFHLAS